MRGTRPFVEGIALELDMLIEQACYLSEKATTPTWDDIDRLRQLGKAWDKAGRPLYEKK